MSLESLKVQIIKKAWADPAFKKSLLSDPKKAVKEAFGVEVPAEIEVKVVEESPSLAYLVLPPNPEDVADGESNVRFPW
ncbi:NHLP leader peptide family RiPP precursor [Cohnella cholangitidis]|uniref:NHLP leader peptide family natural product n=1 Tax=Cohnella cholangitidis TaxID=2598458 RepID=A0A7G5BYG6_9BACL|nr:NHLP leader peptide family RiPP precursor [Cohnella cholangitidis]QMV42000.1 NHLP leader peptide family natural product precursor [Cohnella cholangitidis]